jgi:PAS domain S-box-containing protein
LAAAFTRSIGEAGQRGRVVTFQLRDDGFVPNNPSFPVAVYRSAVKLPRSLDPAAVWEALFESNGRGDTWRDGIYDYVHYHSRIHEVLGIARGSATVRLGGNKGRVLKLKAGDAVVIPAGTGHQCLSASKAFLAVGAYPPNGTYDECGPTVEEHDHNVKAVRKVVNHASTALFGYSAEEALGQRVELIIPDHLRSAHWSGFDAAMTKGATKLQGRPTLTRALHKNGRRLYVEMSFAIVKGDTENEVLGAVAVARDVTERVERERAASRSS